jgi:hypothetical protein
MTTTLPTWINKSSPRTIFIAVIVVTSQLIKEIMVIFSLKISEIFF